MKGTLKMGKKIDRLARDTTIIRYEPENNIFPRDMIIF